MRIRSTRGVASTGASRSRQTTVSSMGMRVCTERMRVCMRVCMRMCMCIEALTSPWPASAFRGVVAGACVADKQWGARELRLLGAGPARAGRRSHQGRPLVESQCDAAPAHHPHRPLWALACPLHPLQPAPAARGASRCTASRWASSYKVVDQSPAGRVGACRAASRAVLGAPRRVGRRR